MPGVVAYLHGEKMIKEVKLIRTGKNSLKY